MFDTAKAVRLTGTIAGAGFRSGDRFVAGLWTDGPLGAMTDVMWARPDGTRILLAPDDATARFVGNVYDFDEVRIEGFEMFHRSDSSVKMKAGPVELELFGGRPWPIFSLRPRWLRRAPGWIRIESDLLRPVLGRFLPGLDKVRGHGTTPSGVREWYSIDSYRPLIYAQGRLDGRELGSMTSLDPPAGFGFSEFPSTPALVECAPLLVGAERFLPPAG